MMRGRCFQLLCAALNLQIALLETFNQPQERVALPQRDTPLERNERHEPCNYEEQAVTHEVGGAHDVTVLHKTED